MRTNENEKVGDEEPGILPPVGVPEMSDKSSHENPFSKPESQPELATKSSSVKDNVSVSSNSEKSDDALPSEWWYIGKPNYS